MYRTTIMLPIDLKSKAQKIASKKGMSLGELIRESLEQRISRSKTLETSDPFFDDENFYTGDVPSSISSKHDDYLYK